MLQIVIRSSIDHPVDDLTGELQGVPHPAVRSHHVDDVQDHVLGGDAVRQPAVDLDPARPQPVHDHGLGRQHVPQLGGADPEGQGAEGPVRRGVRVTAREGEPGLGQALLGAEHVHDAPFASSAGEKKRRPCSAVFASMAEIIASASGSAKGRWASRVGITWSTVATLRSG